MKIFCKIFILIVYIYLNINLVKCQFDLQDYGLILENKHRLKYYWGTYKPNLYFAMRNRRNISDVFGIMWYNPEKDGLQQQGELNQRMRHECKMEDNLSYRWEVHNGEDYGSQIIEDNANNLVLNTKFVKKAFDDLNNQVWDVVIKGDIKDKNKPKKPISLILYSAMENFEVKDKSFFSNFTIDDSKAYYVAEEGGKPKYNIKIHLPNENLISKSYQFFRKIYNNTWKVKNFVVDELKMKELSMIGKNNTWANAEFTTNESFRKQANVVALQLVLQPPFELAISFSTKNLQDEENQDTEVYIDELNSIFKEKENAFNKKFDEIYNLKSKSEEFEDKLPLLREMGKQSLSNILGGIGYFYGAIKINLEGDLEPGKYHKGFRYAVEPKPLFTGTPSRSFFARGFLWDEGFHNIIISQWNKDISVDIIDSWLSTMSATGWMAREQIRGAEAESQVPEKFITQDKMMANPPTLIYPVQNIINFYKFFSEDRNLKYMNSFLKKCFDKFSSWYEWFEIYQKSSGDKKSYQWYGRNTEHNLASGLDDYPRGMTPNVFEKHLDLNAWVIEMMKVLRDLSEIFDYEMVEYFTNRIAKTTEEFKNTYYDEGKDLMNDFMGPQFKLLDLDNFKRPVPPYLWRGDGRCGVDAPNPLGKPSECNPYSDSPCCSEFGWCGNTQNHCKCPKCSRAIRLEDRPEFKKENIFNAHIGYVNLYPIAFGLLKPNDKAFRQTLSLLKDETELNGPYGIRSLSKSDLLYHTGEDYWRGNIWINLNFLVLKGLFKYYKNHQEAFGIYKDLRSKLINTVFNEWKVSKTFYEQYSDVNGKGLRARPFNGWTSLILNIIAEKYE